MFCRVRLVHKTHVDCIAPQTSDEFILREFAMANHAGTITSFLSPCRCILSHGGVRLVCNFPTLQFTPLFTVLETQLLGRDSRELEIRFVIVRTPDERIEHRDPATVREEGRSASDGSATDLGLVTSIVGSRKTFKGAFQIY